MSLNTGSHSKIAWLIALIWLLALSSVHAAEPPAAELPAAIEKRLADADQYLSSDEMEGRGLGSKGINLAADFIARQFHEAGLRTDLYDATPFQKFSVAIDAELGEDNRLAIIKPESGKGDRSNLPQSGASGAPHKLDLSPFPPQKPETTLLVIGKDFTPLAISGDGEFDLPLLFAGYGITSPGDGYDDYADVDVTGKAVIVLRHQPREAVSDSGSAGLKDTGNILFRHKACNAYEHGAAAVIFCSDWGEIRQRRGHDDPVLSFHVAGTTHTHPDLPVIHCRRALLDEAVRATYGMDMAKLEEDIDRNLRPRSRELVGWRVAGRTRIRHVPCEVKNVLGLLPGHGPHADETVILGAHYDHLGYGSRSSLPAKRGPIYSGADDNASGVSVMLEVARQLAAWPQKLQRQVLFIAFTGEEWGYFGSSHYVNAPLVPLEKTVAMLNFDMVGRLRDNKLTLKGVPSGTGFDQLIERLNHRHEFQLSIPYGGSGPSDQASFYAKKVPIIAFFTGKHADYHRPSDKFPLINLAGMRRIAAFAEDAALALANAPDRPEYVALPPIPRGDPDKRPVFGTVADFTREEAGYAISGVIKGSPAERGGLRAGDVLVRFGKYKIGAPDDFEDALRKYRPGERVRVRVRRGTASMTFEVTLEPPKLS